MKYFVFYKTPLLIKDESSRYYYLIGRSDTSAGAFFFDDYNTTGWGWDPELVTNEDDWPDEEIVSPAEVPEKYGLISFLFQYPELWGYYE